MPINENGINLENDELYLVRIQDDEVRYLENTPEVKSDKKTVLEQRQKRMDEFHQETEAQLKSFKESTPNKILELDFNGETITATYSNDEVHVEVL